MAIYFFDKNQTLIKIVPESATFEAIQTQELDDDSLLKDTLSVTIKGDEKLIDAEYMAVKSYKGNAQTFDMYRIVTDTTPDKSMSFTGMSLAPYELNGHIIQDLRPANHSLSYTLNRVLDGTDWRVGYIEDGLSNVTTTFYYVSAKEALKELQSLVGCEFVFKVEISGQKITDKWVEVYSEMGNRTKKRFNYGTNALTVVRKTNKADIYTALIGRGKGEEVSSGEDNASGQAGYGRKITFEDIEWKKSSGKPLDKPKGQYYLELPQATQAYGIKNIDGTMKARVGIIDFDDEEDKNRLINLTYQQLLVSSRPKVLFKTTVANIGATGIGDTVTIHRHDLNIHYQTRVRKIVRNKLNDNKTQIELGDAVVTPSTKQAKQNNATIKNLNNEIEKVKANVTTSQNSADGKNTIFYGSAEPTQKRTGDTWYRPHPIIAGETQMLTWNGTAWELVIDTSDLTSVSRAVEDAERVAGEAVQVAKDADDRANSALEKAGANANLLTTHQNTLNTIKNTTLPDINQSLSDAIGEARSALSSASSAMDEAKKADGKIADYVTRNGLVNGTTVDSKIDTATGAISRKITSLETNKLDGTTYTDFYNNEYKQTAKGVTDTWEAVNKIVDENGNTTDTFAQAVYEKNATKQSADFKKVTDDLVTTTTYNAGVEGINKSISTVQGNLDNLSVGGRNLIANTEFPSGYNNTYLNFGVMSSTYVGTTYRDTFTGQTTIIPKGEDYVVSFYAKASANVETACHFYNPNSTTQAVSSTGQTSAKQDGGVGVSITTEWQRYWVRWKQISTNTTTKKSLIIGRNANVPSGTVVSIAGVKLEEGTIPTDWTPAPEDMQSVAGLDDNITAIYNNTSSETSKAINKTLSAYTKDTDFDTKTQSYLTNKQYQTASQIATTLGAYTKTTSLDSTVASYLNNSTSATAGAINTKLTAYQTTTGLDSSVSSLLSNTNSQTAKGFNSKLTDIEGKIPTYVGGRNLLVDKDAKVGYVNVGSTSIVYREHLRVNEYISIEPNTDYSLSGNAYELWRINWFTADRTYISGTSFDTRGDVKTKTFTSPANAQLATVAYPYGRVKFEQGSVVTDWTPAPEDMQNVSDLDANITAIYNNKSSETAKAISRELTNYAKTTDLNGLVTETALSNKKFATASSVSTQLQSYAKSTDLNGLATESYVSSQMTATAKVIRTEVTAVEDKIPTELGGRNIIKDTEGIFKFTKTNASGYTDFLFRNTTVVPDGKEYILSFKAKASAPMVLRSHFYNPSTTTRVETSTGFSTSASDGTAETRITTEWNSYWIKWSQTETTTPKSVIVARVRDAYNNITLEMKEIKLEKGNVPTDWTPAPEDKADQSQITQLADNINLKVSKSDLISQINVQAEGVLITSGTNKLNVTPTTTYIENGTIKSAMIESLDAGKITTGELDAGKVKVINLDAKNITANKTSFVQSVWNSLESSISINATGLLSKASDSSQVYLQNGVVGARTPSGATIGQIGYAYESSSPWYSMQVSHGSHFQIRMSRGDGQLNKQAFYIISGGTESYLNTDNIYFNPSSSGRVRVQGAMTVDKDIRAEGTVLIRSRIEFLNGGSIESQSANSNMVIGASNKMIIYTNGTNALEFDANNAVFRRKISENSDIRLKTNIVDMPIDSLDAIRNMEIKKFDYLDGRTNYYGIIAQQAQQYLPELINTDSEGYLMVDKSAMTYVNMHAIQQLDSKVDDELAKTNDEVAQLKAQIANLQDELALLKGA